ncbi:MAG TPA: plastocyanin/azurin family copper-binding protein [Actinomycetota bacterium]|jgi:plastocyanin
MRRLLVGLCAFALVGALASPASSAAAAAGPGGFAAGFVTPVVVSAPGEPITFANFDVAPHNFVASSAFLSKKLAKKAKWCSAYDKGKCPVFWSQTISAGETTEVEGVDLLKSGTQYEFFCSLHPNMKGTLVVR